MAHNNPFDDNQFVISYELLNLLQWLIDNEQETLKKMVLRANMNAQRQVDHRSDDIQQTVIDFFSLLDALLIETEQEYEVQTALQRVMIPAIDHIDTSMCDSNALALSVAKATQALENKTGENPKDVLCKELLKRWKPSKKPYAH